MPHHQLNRKKRPVLKPKANENDVWIGSKSIPKLLEKRCLALLEKHSELCLHALGSSIYKAVLLALSLKTKSKIEWVVDTTSTQVLDEIEPQDLDASPHLEQRFTSSICIRISKRQD